MSRSRTQKDTGIMSVQDISKMLGFSLPTIRNWFDANRFKKGYVMPFTRERRVPATSVKEFLIVNNMPIPSELQEWVDNYVAMHNRPRSPQE